MQRISDLAEKLGKNKSTISRHATRLGVGTRKGRDVWLSDSEAKRVAGSIATSRVGNPNLLLGKGLRKSGKK